VQEQFKAREADLLAKSEAAWKEYQKQRGAPPRSPPAAGTPQPQPWPARSCCPATLPPALSPAATSAGRAPLFRLLEENARQRQAEQAALLRRQADEITKSKKARLCGC
jgi:hypothetical protein